MRIVAAATVAGCMLASEAFAIAPPPEDAYASCDGKKVQDPCNGAYDVEPGKTDPPAPGGQWSKSSQPGTCVGAGARLFCESQTQAALREATAAVASAKTAASSVPAAAAPEKKAGMCAASPGGSSSWPGLGLIVLACLLGSRRRGE